MRGASIDKRVQHPDLMRSLPKFEVCNDLLYHIEEGSLEGEEVEQLLIPKMYRSTLLRIVHELPMEGHLGRDKWKRNYFSALLGWAVVNPLSNARKWHQRDPQ